MLPVMQIRSLTEARSIAVLGVVVTLVAVAIYLTLISSNKSGASGTDVGFPRSSGALDAAKAFATVLFAYQGQTIFPEVIHEMKVFLRTTCSKKTISCYT